MRREQTIPAQKQSASGQTDYRSKNKHARMVLETMQQDDPSPPQVPLLSPHLQVALLSSPLLPSPNSHLLRVKYCSIILKALRSLWASAQSLARSSTSSRSCSAPPSTRTSLSLFQPWTIPNWSKPTPSRALRTPRFNFENQKKGGRAIATGRRCETGKSFHA